MHTKSIMFATLIAVLQVLSFVHGHRVYNESKRSSCNQFDPQGVKNLNFDDLAGKWYIICLIPTSAVVLEPTLDIKMDWVCGTNVAIKHIRLKHNPNLCSTLLREFTPIPNTDGSSFNVTFEELHMVFEWRVLYLDSEFAISWLCFHRDANNVCDNVGGGVFRRTANQTIGDEDMKRLDAIIKQKTCKTVTESFVLHFPVNNECRDWGLPTKTTCN